jgi:hypothetical protein
MINIKKILYNDCMEFVCFVRISKQTSNLALPNIQILVFITEVDSVYSAVRAEFLYMARIRFVFKRLTLRILSETTLSYKVQGGYKLSDYITKPYFHE